jgi:hypothetical protein
MCEVVQRRVMRSARGNEAICGAFHLLRASDDHGTAAACICKHVKIRGGCINGQIVMKTSPACYNGALATPADDAFFTKGGAWWEQDSGRRRNSHCF